mgnify:CR=1 FL=1
MAKKKQNTAFNVQVADFIRNHKKAGTAIDDEVTEKLVIPFVLDADGIDDLLERLTDGGISITDKEGNPSLFVRIMTSTLSTCAQLERDNISFRLQLLKVQSQQ